jgi:hypothetical protein
MQLLIVHRDPEMGDALVRMMNGYTQHDCALVRTDNEANEWGRRHRTCALLLTQLEADGIDGLALGGSLSEIFPGLQVLFFPSYPASDRRLEVRETKVFPEPIDGDGLLEAVERAENAPPNAPDLFHVVDVLQMCCLSRRSGAIQMVADDLSGLVFLRAGKIVHAETTSERGKEALYEIAAWDRVEFAYERSVRPPMETIAMPWHEILIAAVARNKEEKNGRSRRSA